MQYDTLGQILPVNLGLLERTRVLKLSLELCLCLWDWIHHWRSVLRIKIVILLHWLEISNIFVVVLVALRFFTMRVIHRVAPSSHKLGRECNIGLGSLSVIRFLEKDKTFLWLLNIHRLIVPFLKMILLFLHNLFIWLSQFDGVLVFTKRRLKLMIQ